MKKLTIALVLTLIGLAMSQAANVPGSENPVVVGAAWLATIMALIAWVVEWASDAGQTTP